MRFGPAPGPSGATGLSEDLNLPHLLIRADSGGSIGLGHAIRCLALARALRDAGVGVRFAARELPGSALATVGAAGFEVAVLPAGEETPLGDADLRATVKTARQAGSAGVVVDHYGATPGYLAALRDAGLRVAVIDDLGDRDLGAADWVLNGGAGAAALAYRTRPGGILLAGPEYALLRPEFAAARGRARAFAPGDARVLVSLGGGDGAPAAVAVLRGLAGCPRLQVTVLARPTPELAAAAGSSPHAVTLVQSFDHPADLMAGVDLSINAAGMTSLELSCLGVPMLVFVLSPDQQPNALALEGWGNAERIADDPPGDVGARVDALLADPDRRRQMSARGMERVDGLGVVRAASDGTLRGW